MYQLPNNIQNKTIISSYLNCVKATCFVYACTHILLAFTWYQNDGDPLGCFINTALALVYLISALQFLGPSKALTKPNFDHPKLTKVKGSVECAFIFSTFAAIGSSTGSALVLTIVYNSLFSDPSIYILGIFIFGPLACALVVYPIPFFVLLRKKKTVKKALLELKKAPTTVSQTNLRPPQDQFQPQQNFRNQNYGNQQGVGPSGQGGYPVVPQ